MNNKFRRVAAFALAMTVIAGSSNVFDFGVGGLPNLTSIVANAENEYKVYNLTYNDKTVNFSKLNAGDMIVVADDIDDAGILNDTGATVNINQSSLENGNEFSLGRGYKYKVTSREGGGFNVTKIKFTYIDASFSGGETEETILSEQSITANADVVILNKDNKVTNWKNGQTYVVMDSIGISDRITVNGTVKLILCDGATLTAEKGITVGEGQTLNIFGQKKGSGTLNTYTFYEHKDPNDESGDYYGAAIGGYGRYNGGVYTNAGTIRIYGGKINARNNDIKCDNVAVIGGGYYGEGGTVEIYNGTVTAISTKYASPAIGGNYDAGTVKIYGGFVNVIGGDGAAGIGTSFGNPGGANVEIYGGEVTASGGSGGNGIGRGFEGESDGTLKVGKDVEVHGSVNPINECDSSNLIEADAITGNYDRTRYMKTIGKQPEMEIKAPTITTQPSNIEVKKDSTSGNTLTVAANADTGCAFSYQWYSSTDNSVGTNEDNILINGATNSTYTVPTDTVGKNYYYCEVTAKKGSQSKTTISNIAEAGVYYEASFTSGAVDASGTIAAIKSYDGKVTLPAAGFTRNGYDLAGWKIGDSDRIDANTEANISDNAIFTAQWYKPVLGINNSNVDDNSTIPVVVGYNKTETLSANVIDDDSYVYTYQWYEDDAVIQRATSPNYTIPTGKEVGEHKYYCEVTAKHKKSNNTITAKSVTITFKVNSISVQDYEITADLVFEGKQTPEAINVKYRDTTPLNSTNDYDVEEVKDGEGNLCAVKITLKGNYSGSKIIPFNYTPAKEPTHNTNGNVEYWTYNDVNYIKENGKFKKADNVSVPSTSINSNIRVQTSRIEPTSEKDGYIITKIYCADCGKLISYKRVRIPKLS